MKSRTSVFIVSNSTHTLWAFQDEENARFFAELKMANARTAGDPMTYDVMELKFMDDQAESLRGHITIKPGD